jgi:alpha-glucosidase
MGDNHSWWEHLEMSLPQLINMGLSNVPFVGTDIGGFADHGNAELFTRWMQAGSLAPFCRAHTSLDTRRNEPWAFGPRTEAICREYLQLRYRLMPYIYSQFWQAHLTGEPVMRALFYAFPEDESTYAIGDQFMLGPELMAAPVLRPGRTSREVYLPEGTWFDWWSGEVYPGKTDLIAAAPLERMPLYVRGGAIIPQSPIYEDESDRPADCLYLDVFPGEGAFSLYEDDGQTRAYLQDDFCTTEMRQSRDANGFRLEIDRRNGNFKPPERTVEVRIRHASAVRTDQGEVRDNPADALVKIIRYADRGESVVIHYTA